MKITERSRLVVLTLASVALAACATDSTPTTPQLGATAPAASRVDDESATGAVYTETNDPAGNAIRAFRRAADGSLSPLATVSTGGLGAGGTTDPLASQYALVLRGDHRVLYAVNAGSNDVSSFRVADDGSLTLVDRVPSGGVRPVSLASRENLLYVLNTSSNTIQGFRATRSGTLSPIPFANVSLLPGAAGASAIHFSGDGGHVIVTERNSNRIETFAVDENGRLGAPVPTASHGAVPFSLDNGFDGSEVVVEAGGAAPNGALSSYTLGQTGALQTVTGSLSTQNVASCWIIATSDGRYVYAINAGSATITGASVSAGGALTLLNANGVTASTGAGSTPLDPAVAGGNRFLYVLKAGTGTIEGFAIGNDHGLTALGDAGVGAPRSGQQGLAAY